MHLNITYGEFFPSVPVESFLSFHTCESKQQVRRVESGSALIGGGMRKFIYRTTYVLDCLSHAQCTIRFPFQKVFIQCPSIFLKVVRGYKSRRVVSRMNPSRKNSTLESIQGPSYSSFYKN